MVTASQASLDIVVAVVGVVAVFLHHDGKAHGVYLRVLAGSQRLHDDVLRAVHDDLGGFRFAYALVVQDAVLRPQHPQLTGAEGLAGVAQLRQLASTGFRRFSWLSQQKKARLKGSR